MSENPESLKNFTPNRECGDCSLCCKLMFIVENDEESEEHTFIKEPGEWCQYVCPAHDGCSIHTERPEPCRKFDCSWLKGFFDDDLQPNRVGFVVYIGLFGGKYAWIVTHDWSFSQEALDRAVAQMATNYVYTPLGYHILPVVVGPAEKTPKTVHVLLPGETEWQEFTTGEADDRRRESSETEA